MYTTNHPRRTIVLNPDNANKTKPKATLGNFDGDGYLTMFWGSTQSTIGANAEHLQIEAGATAVFLNNNHKQYAQYVRCIQD